MDAWELERKGQEEDPDYYTSEDPVEEFLVHDDEVTHEIVDYLLDKKSANKAELSRTQARHASILDSEHSSLGKSRWKMYTSEEGILEKRGTESEIVYWGLDMTSEYTQTLKENTELDL